VLSPGGIKAVDNLTVQFTLDQPTASFPYLTSSTTYQAIILPKNYQLGTYTKTPQTTGASCSRRTRRASARSTTATTNWWGGKAPLDGVDAVYFNDEAADDLGLLGGQIDLCAQVQFATGRAVFNNKNVTIFSARGRPPRDLPPRQPAQPDQEQPRPTGDGAHARPAEHHQEAVQRLRRRRQRLAVRAGVPVDEQEGAAAGQEHRKAKQLMAQAGYAKGFPITLTTEKTGEIPQLAQIFQSSVKQIGINMKLQILTATAYFAGTQTARRPATATRRG
jgi:peptide/nickel transport system substrate-binding protein